MKPRACLRAALGAVILGAAAPAPVRGAGAASPATTADGFALPQPGHVFSFPRDHGTHPDFKLEWWYVTGHLYAADGHRWGFQATFFRRAAPDQSTQVYLAHMALVDTASGRFLHQERLARAGWDADASDRTLAVRHGPWRLTLDAPAPGVAGAPAPEVFELEGGVRNEARFHLVLAARQPLVAFGDHGYSRKGAEREAASYYLTFPRLAVQGELAVGDAAPVAVTGEAWMDHEISSSQLGAEQVGWDWISIQFQGQPARELMLYRMRRRDGTLDPASTLQWVGPGGAVTAGPFTWEVLSRWRSPATHADYPAKIRLTTTDPATGASVAFTIEPLVAGQELAGGAGGISYWEGACRVRDAQGREVGSAYMELTGYSADLKF